MGQRHTLKHTVYLYENMAFWWLSTKPSGESEGYFNRKVFQRQTQKARGGGGGPNTGSLLNEINVWQPFTFISSKRIVPWFKNGIVDALRLWFSTGPGFTLDIKRQPNYLSNYLSKVCLLNIYFCYQYNPELHKQQKCDRVWVFSLLNINISQQPIIHKTQCGRHTLYLIWSDIFTLGSFVHCFWEKGCHVTCTCWRLIWFQNIS